MVKLGVIKIYKTLILPAVLYGY